MFKDAKVGDRVWSITDGWGTIYNIDTDSEWPVKVKFENVKDSFDYDGKEHKHECNPTLFWDEITIVPPPRPKRKVVKKGTVYLNIYPNHITAYANKDQAILVNKQSDIVAIAVPSHYSYEVEE
jgi:hypothetical protein